MVDHEDPAPVTGTARDDLDIVRGSWRGHNPATAADLLEELQHARAVERGSHIVRNAGTERSTCDRGRSGSGSARILREDLGGGDRAVFAKNPTGPEPRQLDLLLRQEGEELLHRDTEQLRERARIRSEVQVVVLVDDAREVGHDQRAALFDVTGEVVDPVLGDQVLHRHDHDVVAAHLVDRTTNVARHPGREEGRVPPAGLGDDIHVDAGVIAQLIAPPGIGVMDDRHGRRRHPRADDLRDRLQGPAQLDNLAPAGRRYTAVRQHRRMKLLGARHRGAPLEEQGGVRPPRDVLHRVAQHLAWRLGPVARLPVDGRGGVLHQHPRFTPREAAQEVGGHRELLIPPRIGGDQVVIVRDDVHLLRPLPVVDRLVEAHREAHEIRRHRMR